MNDQEAKPSQAIVSRRNFVKKTAVFGAIVTSKTRPMYAQDKTSPNEIINVAQIGCGQQGQKQSESCLSSNGTVKGIRFTAVCDIWEQNPLKLQSRRLAALQGLDKPLPAYTDYREMLEKEADNIDAVLIATPDFLHHVHTRASLEAGKHVYCEKMMSNSIEAAADMVRAQRENPNLRLQVGHQRRSNPRYLALKHRLIDEEKAFGRITHASAQWNRGTNASGGGSIPKKVDIWPSLEVLQEAGYAEPGMSHEEAMEQFVNWRMYRKFGGGVISDLGAHQIDIFNWFFDTAPTSVVASGGVDYYEGYELPDNVMSVYEYDTPEGRTRAYYQVLTTSSSLGVFERFLGDAGTVSISEIAKVNQAYPETDTDWEPLAKKGLLIKGEDIKYNPWDIPKTWGEKPEPWIKSTLPSGTGIVDSRATKAASAWELATTLEELPHTPHLRNFFDAVRSGRHEDLNCNVDEAFKTCVTVLKIYEAIRTGCKVSLTAADFEIA